MKLRSKILLPIIGSLVVAMLIAYWGINAALNSLVGEQVISISEFSETTVEAAAKIKVEEVYNNLDRIGLAALQQVSTFSQLPAVVEAYRIAHAGNIDDPESPQSQEAREQLREIVRPALAGFKAVTGKNNLQIHYHLPNGRSLARAYKDWQVTRDGKKLDISDDISGFRATVMQINQGEHKPIAGVEVGRAGFDIRGLAAVTAPDGQHFGSVEVQFPLSRLLDVSRTSEDQFFAVYMDHRLLNIATRMNDPVKNPLVGNEFVFVDATDRRVTDPLVDLKLLRAGFSSPSFSQSGQHQLVAFPLKDFSGKSAGVIVVATDISGWQTVISDMRTSGQHKSAELRLQSGVFVALMLIVVCGVIFVVTRRVTGPILEAVRITDKIAHGDSSERFPTRAVQGRNQDEVQQLQSSINVLVDGMNQREQVALAIADGDLSRDIVPLSERDGLGRALQTMVVNLRDLIGQMQTAGEQIASGSSQVADGSQSLSQGATEQASSLEQITASMTQMGSQTRQSAENATQANTLTAVAREAAEGGNAQMQQMVMAMGEINESGQNISKIIKTIDEIAFQTNLLALNAAVEAARAGQHGKGFAVVAEEVRNLAARSAKAARETADLIEGSVKKAVNGAKIADLTAGALGEIVGGIAKVSDLVAEIAAASNEQAQGISQVNQGLGQIDQVTQQNTASAEESAAAAEELSSQAAHLRQMLGRFKLKNSIASPASTVEEPKRALAAPVERSEERFPSPAAPRPEAIIALDDSEFGRY